MLGRSGKLVAEGYRALPATNMVREKYEFWCYVLDYKPKRET